jgi:signal transduction histidine kinase
MSDPVLEPQIPLGELLDLRSFGEVCRSFVELYKIGLKVFDTRGSKLVDIKVGSGDFCGYVFTNAEGARRCTSCVGRVKSEALEGTGAHVVQCATGTRYLILPLLHDDRLLGRAVFGPYVPEDLAALPPTFTDLGGLDFDRARELMGRIRRTSDATVARILEHFVKVVDVLVFSAYKVHVTSRLHIASVREAYRELTDKNARLEATNRKLQELDQLKSNFLATVSHELRTPLTSIIGYSEMLAEGLAGALTGEQLEYVKTIMDKGVSLLALITSILDLTRIEAGKLKLLPEPIDLADLLDNAISCVRPQALKKGLSVDVAIEEGLGRPELDREKLRQCLVNLLANAVKFTPRGGRVTVAARRANRLPASATGRFDGPEGYFVLAVEDTGIGIPEEQQARIFETFYQVDGGSTREFGGAGLGLAIVRSYVEAHGGEISVDSKPGEGSRFSLLLPRVVVATVTPGPAPAQPARAAS